MCRETTSCSYFFVFVFLSCFCLLPSALLSRSLFPEVTDFCFNLHWQLPPLGLLHVSVCVYIIYVYVCVSIDTKLFDCVG
jgi:hypothetical protein